MRRHEMFVLTLLAAIMTETAQPCIVTGVNLAESCLCSGMLLRLQHMLCDVRVRALVSTINFGNAMGFDDHRALAHGCNA